jgi:prepilin-type N-terminal cleavage/methylation domain-containing protein
MFRSLSRKRKFGFTLVEVLVTTVVIGVLAAVVLPALARQTTAADPARIASDLNNIKMGMELFSQNVRPEFPGDLEDLVRQPDAAGLTTSSSAGDLALDDQPYTSGATEKWQGPYVAQSLAEFKADSGSTNWRAGAAGFFENKLKICDIAQATACTPVVSGNGAFVTIQLNDLTTTETASLNDLLDGPGEALSTTAGMFRTHASGTPSFYYTIPFIP